MQAAFYNHPLKKKKAFFNLDVNANEALIAFGVSYYPIED